MAQLSYLVMTEYHNEAEASGENFSRRFAFQSAESMVNNLHHGRPDQIWMKCVLDAFASTLSDSRITPLDADEREAYNDAIMIIEIFAEQHGVQLTD